MARQVTLPASKTKINDAGKTLRAAASGADVPAADLQSSLDLIQAFRAAHGYPLRHVRAGLRHHAFRASGGAWFDLSQRLKQLETITDKLVRLPRTNLARMQDIGGCRVVFLDQQTVDATIASIEARARRGTWTIVDLDDYVDARHRRDGYRAKHLIVLQGGVQIEIQFRTAHQHNWAQLMENLDKAAGLGLKRGVAPEWANDAVAAAADDMSRYESGTIERAELVQRLNRSLRPILEVASRTIT